jgi:hypothetical protein
MLLIREEETMIAILSIHTKQKVAGSVAFGIKVIRRDLLVRHLFMPVLNDIWKRA